MWVRAGHRPYNRISTYHLQILNRRPNNQGHALAFSPAGPAKLLLVNLASKSFGPDWATSSHHNLSRARLSHLSHSHLSLSHLALSHFFPSGALNPLMDPQTQATRTLGCLFPSVHCPGRFFLKGNTPGVEFTKFELGPPGTSHKTTQLEVQPPGDLLFEKPCGTRKMFLMPRGKRPEILDLKNAPNIYIIHIYIVYSKYICTPTHTYYTASGSNARERMKGKQILETPQRKDQTNNIKHYTESKLCMVAVDTEFSHFHPRKHVVGCNRFLACIRAAQACLRISLIDGDLGVEHFGHHHLASSFRTRQLYRSWPPTAHPFSARACHPPAAPGHGSGHPKACQRFFRHFGSLLSLCASFSRRAKCGCNTAVCKN